MSKIQWNFKVFLTWMAAFLFALLLAFGLYSVYIKSEQRPLSTAVIPQETIDWFKGLIDGGSDIGGILGPDDRNPSDWSKYEDIDSMLHIEDNLFIIYYSQEDSVVERKKALISQRYAHDAVPIGELFMKNYPYPSQEKMNGRKLPIYLAKTVDDFRSICKQLGHGDPGTWAIGLYCFQYSLSGVYTDGIIISPEAWSVTDFLINDHSEDKEFKKTLWHEMNHFMYFTNWDYTQTTQPCLWFTEGLAEYFAENYERLSYVGDHQKYELTENFRDGNEYWVGLSAIMCLEKMHSKSVVSDIVENTYKNSVEKAVQMRVPNESLKSWNTKWHSYMDNKEYKK